MKKNVLGLLMMMLVFVGCEGPMGPMGPPGEPGEGAPDWAIYDVTIRPDQWFEEADENGLNNYLICEVDVPRLSEFVYNNGIAIPYLIGADGTQTALNCSVPRENVEGQAWTEYYSYDILTGSMAFYVRYSDYYMVLPPTMKFRIVLLS